MPCPFQITPVVEKSGFWIDDWPLAVNPVSDALDLGLVGLRTL
jgi:hypothetical protein